MICLSISLLLLPVNRPHARLPQEKEIMKEIMDNGPVQGKASYVNCILVNVSFRK